MENPETLATYGTQDEEKQNKKHNTICVIHHYTQTNTTQYVLYTTIHKQTQHNMCYTPLCTNKQNKKHNTICVVHHYTQTNKTKTQHNMCCNINTHFSFDVFMQ